LREARLRPARADDARSAADLILASAPDMYARLAGGAERAAGAIERAFGREGTSTSSEVVTLAEQEDDVVAAMCAFPAEQSARRARAFQRVLLATLPPWRWPGSLWLYWIGARAAPQPPRECLYVDALATAPGARRRGVARALLAEAERRARRQGLGEIALDTSLDNRAARALYLSEGFEEVAYKPAGHGLPGFVALVKALR
jgi:ribosomal protein S18 acetylase RimI-like enzyme